MIGYTIHMFESIFGIFQHPTFVLVFRVLYYTSFVWLPVILLIGLRDLFLNYRRAQFFSKQKNVLLEIRLPREIFKSPQAMEFFIAGLYQPFGDANWYEKYWKGATIPSFSLEIVSIEGEIHFFIWTREGHRNRIEANLYSQYPGIEIYTVPDYTLPVSYDPTIHGMWTSEFSLTKSDAFPIKTYIDYKLDKDPKEEYKIDPLTPLIEFLGTLGRGEQAWLQIIIRAHRNEDKDPKTGEKIDLKWKKAAEEEKEKILKKSKGEKGPDDKIIPGTSRFLTDGETETVKALERSISKTGFDVGMRAVYIAPKDTFNPGNIGGIIGGVTHFNSSLNGFKPSGMSTPKYKYFPWKDRNPKVINWEKQDMLDAYKRRAYFYPPYKRPHFVLNTEELATLFHFPGGVSTTPTFARIGSKKSDAPSNLPI